MKLYKLEIKGFRRLKEVVINFGDASFLIGENNSGKSTVLKALEIYLSAKKKLPNTDFTCEFNSETDSNDISVDRIEMVGEFRNVPREAIDNKWRGFKGRIFDYEVPEGVEESGLRIFYRKTYKPSSDVVVELRSLKRVRKEEYSDEKITYPQDLINAGCDENLITELYSDVKKKLSNKERELLDQIDDIWDTCAEEEWVVNPGGIMQNVITKLPKYLFIPAEDRSSELESQSGALIKTLKELFEDVRSVSTNYTRAQEFLEKLAEEMDPSDNNSEFGRMMGELNTILNDVFPDSKINATANLSGAETLKPTFEVDMLSNVKTPISNQGTGMVRASVFALLRYRQHWNLRRENQDLRSIIIGFEEPEIYQHPNSAVKLRQSIYDLASGNSQIICSTHSPWMIDLSKKPRQVLNSFQIEDHNVLVSPFNISDEFISLSDDDRSYVKMILKMDDQVSRVFFAKRTIIVEGDTEDIVIRESVDRMTEEIKNKIKSEVEVVKARGKAAIIPLVKYFKAMNIKVFVIHDRDLGVEGAERFNGPILEAVGDENNRIMLEECIEDVLGYESPTYDKPYKAYTKTKEWGENYENIPENWRNILNLVFAEEV